jgi:hypothetical protein
VDGLAKVLQGKNTWGLMMQARSYAMESVLAVGWTKDEAMAWLKDTYGERPAGGYPLAALDRMCQHIRAGDQQREY